MINNKIEVTDEMIASLTQSDRLSWRVLKLVGWNVHQIRNGYVAQSPKGVSQALCRTVPEAVSIVVSRPDVKELYKVEITEEVLAQLTLEQRTRWVIAQHQGYYVRQSLNARTVVNLEGYALDGWEATDDLITTVSNWRIPDYIDDTDAALSLMDITWSLYRVSVDGELLWSCGIFDESVMVDEFIATTPALAIVGMYVTSHKLDVNLNVLKLLR
jgi:hypothetical protein